MGLGKPEGESGFLPCMPYDLSQETQAQNLQDKGKSGLRSFVPIVSNFLVQWAMTTAWFKSFAALLT